MVYSQKNMPAEAMQAFRQSVTIAPEYVPGHVALGQMLLAEGRADEAIAELRQAVALAPEQPQIHAILAEALQAKGLNIEAQQEMRKAGVQR